MGASSRSSKALLPLLVALFFVCPALADGFRIEHGRFVGKVTELRLTDRQIKSLAASRDLKLTVDQKARLQATAGVAPSELFVYFTKDGETDCTCGAFNLAMRYSERWIEVPHQYLLDDTAAAERKRELEEQ